MPDLPINRIADVITDSHRMNYLPPEDVISLAREIAAVIGGEVERLGTEVTQLRTDLIQTAEGRLAAWNERDEIRAERDLAVLTAQALRDQLAETRVALGDADERWAALTGPDGPLAAPGAWTLWCPGCGDQPAVHHACPGSPEVVDVGRPVDATIASILELAAEHACGPVDGGA